MTETTKAALRMAGYPRALGSRDTLREGQKIRVEQADGSQRAGISVGEAEARWFGGSPGAYVV
jgi:hypothetical protein